MLRNGAGAVAELPDCYGVKLHSVLPDEISKYSCMLTPKVHKKFMALNFKIGTRRNLSEIV